MWTLLSKELRQLWPVAAMLLALVVAGFTAVSFSTRIDERTFTSWCDGYCQVGVDNGLGLITVLIVLLVAYSLYPREREDQTIDFLNALPIPGIKIFAAKLLAAWLLLLALSLLDQGLVALALWANPADLTGRNFPQVQFWILVREALFVYVLLAHGIFISWFRTFGLVFYAVYLASILLVESVFPGLSYLNVFRMLYTDYNGASLVFDWDIISFHVVVGTAILFAAALLWIRLPGGAAARQADVQSRGSLLAGAIKVFVGTFCLIGAAGYLVLLSQNHVEQDPDTQFFTTDHYRFVLPKGREGIRDTIHSSAEKDYLAVVGILGAIARPNISADLTTSRQHAGGLAQWKSISVDTSDSIRPADFRRVLVHETAHVFQAVESNRALMRNRAATRFFVEGMAQYVAYAVVPEPALRRAEWQAAAIAWERQKIQFEHLIDNSVFSRRYDWQFFYSLGDIWSSVLVETCGKEILGDVLRASGRTDAPGNLGPYAFWQDTLQFSGCELLAVIDAFRKRIRGLASEYGDDGFVRFERVTAARFSPERGDVFVTADVVNNATGAAPSERWLPRRYSIRIDREVEVGGGYDPVISGEIVNESGRQFVRFRIPARHITQKSFFYQLGFKPRTGQRVFYERWRRITLSD